MSLLTLLGETPIYKPDDPWALWNARDMYTGPTGEARYVPKVGDWVAESVGNLAKLSLVTDLDTTTFLHTRIALVSSNNGGADEGDIILGDGPGNTHEIFRLYINKSVIPHTLTTNRTTLVYGSQNSHVKIFRGTEIGANGQVISAFYNQNMEYVSENIPLELVATDNMNNVSIKTLLNGFTNADLDDGEMATVVVYSDVNEPVSETRFIVKNTDYVRSSEISQRYIESVRLKSPYLSAMDDSVLDIPKNLPLSSLGLEAVVTYSDGHMRTVNVDGTKVELVGMENYLPTIDGQESKLLLLYHLGPNEFAMDVVGPPNRRAKAEPYTVRTLPVRGSASVKLYVVPQWIDEFTGWRLDYFMYSLERGTFYFATPYIEPGVNSPPFDPLLYGITQWLTVALDIDSVDPLLKPHRHVQTFGIALMANGLSEDTSWLINQSPSQTPPYGTGLVALVNFESIGNWEVDISCGLSDIDEWLEKVYYAVEPQFDSTRETKAPLPTHFILNLNGLRNEYPVASWNAMLPSLTGGLNGRSAILEWRRAVGDDVLELGCSPLKIRQVL